MARVGLLQAGGLAEHGADHRWARVDRALPQEPRRVPGATRWDACVHAHIFTNMDMGIDMYKCTTQAFLALVHSIALLRRRRSPQRVRSRGWTRRPPGLPPRLSPKFVRHAFEHALRAHGGDAASDAAGCPAPPGADEVAARPSGWRRRSCSRRVGPMPRRRLRQPGVAAAARPPKRGATIGVFSYGSGAAATMLRCACAARARSTMGCRASTRASARPPTTAVCRRLLRRTDASTGRPAWLARQWGPRTASVVWIRRSRRSPCEFDEFTPLPLGSVQLVPEINAVAERSVAAPTPPQLTELTQPVDGERLALPATDAPVVVRAVVSEVVGRDVGDDVPLMEAGLDSLGAVELRSRLAQRLGGAAEQPLPERSCSITPRCASSRRALRRLPRRPPPAAAALPGELLAGLTSLLASSPPTKSPQPACFAAGGRVALVGASAVLPGGAGSTGAAWLVAARALTPSARCRLSDGSSSRFRGAERGGAARAARRLRARRRALRPPCFGVSVAEATTMDPQQRLVLEQGYAALPPRGSIVRRCSAAPLASRSASTRLASMRCSRRGPTRRACTR